ncbi:MAG: hypothetical protein RSB13_03745 [Aurantimicrobium sp.]
MRNLLTPKGIAHRNWLIAGAAILAVVVILVLNIVSSGNGSATSIGSSSTGFSTPAGAAVLEVGAVSGPDGSALLNVRDASLTSLNIQFLEFGDEASINAALAAGTGNAAIVPASTKLKTGQVVVAKLYNVEAGGTEGVHVLIAPKDSPLQAELQTLAKALQSQESLDYLNSISGYSVSKIK